MTPSQIPPPISQPLTPDDRPPDRPRYVLGIDGGGTKTACVVVSETGETIAQAESHASNYHAVGAEVAQANIRLAIEQALNQTQNQTQNQTSHTTHDDAPRIDICGIGLGLAGVASREDVAVVRGWVAEYIAEAIGGCRWEFHAGDHDRVYIDHDCAIALTGGVASVNSGNTGNAGNGIGIAAIAGTGSIVFGRSATGETARVGGWGYLLGDEGSGYDIARRGLQAALTAADGRGESTDLLAEFQAHFQARSPRDLAMTVYRHRLPVRDMAALSVIVDRVATAGDAVARGIVHGAASDVAIAIGACADHLKFTPDDPFEVVTIGGVWQSQAGFRGWVAEALHTKFSHAALVWPRSSPAQGAALTVLRSIGLSASKDACAT